MSGQWMTAEQATAKLGVKPQTLYAYVSRGLITSERIPDTRRSRFLRADIERLAARSRRSGPSRGLEVIIETELTLIDAAGHLYYRGWDVTNAARSSTFEEITSWLWTEERDATPFLAPPNLLAGAQQVVDLLGQAPVMDQIRTIVSAIRHLDPFRDDRRVHAVAATGRGLIATVVDALPLIGSPPNDTSIAARLWPRLTAADPTADALRLLDATLIVMADHEMAVSTLAARVAASAWADPYLAVLAGLGALGGPLHGGASTAARGLLAEVASGAPPADAIGARLRAGSPIAGFGHSVYETQDPRAVLLQELMEEHGVDLTVPRQLADLMAARHLPEANVDFMVSVLAESFDMTEAASEVIFAVSRIVGWLAHATEEYPNRRRFRTRAAYIGRQPAASS